MTTTTTPQLSPAFAAHVDEIVDAIRGLAQALIDKTSHPDTDDDVVA